MKQTTNVSNLSTKQEKEKWTRSEQNLSNHMKKFNQMDNHQKHEIGLHRSKNLARHNP